MKKLSKFLHRLIHWLLDCLVAMGEASEWR
jgi:hypothetical protein